MSRFLVTGGSGFLGSHLVERLLGEGHEVLALDNFVTGRRGNLSHLEKEPRLKVVEADLIQGIPNVGKIDGLYHMASPASPEDFVPLGLEILQVGSVGTFHCLEYARKHQAWFLMASTSEVYGDPEKHPQSEDYRGNVNPIGVRGVYDEAKRFSEALTMTFYRSKKVQTSIVRIFNTYGPRMRIDDGRVIPNFVSQALKGEPITIYGDGKQTRSFCYVADLVEGLYRFWDKKPVEPTNLGNNRERTMLELAQEMIALTNSRSEIVYRDLPENDPMQRCPDITRAKKVLGWEPTTSLKDGLRPTIEYFSSLL